MKLEQVLDILNTDTKFKNRQKRLFKRILDIDESITLEKICKIINLFDESEEN